jgi:biofilm PGA synthesis N-glycosyltransferase PgaC
VKLDGDLSFAPDYFERCFEEFARDRALGIGGGTVQVIERGVRKIDSPGDPPFHVRGATKIYRRACWNVISPLVRAPGWDTLDEVRANMRGWRTRTFPHLHVLEHKATGAADGVWRNWYKNGVANYVTGYHPLFMAAKCLKRAFQKPPLAAAALWAGFCSGYVTRTVQSADRETVRYLRREQLRTLIAKPSIYTAQADVPRTSS